MALTIDSAVFTHYVDGGGDLSTSVTSNMFLLCVLLPPPVCHKANRMHYTRGLVL